MNEMQWWWSSSDDPDLMMIQQWRSRSSDDPDLMMIQQWWPRSSDDLDLVMMIQVVWWSRSSDDDLDWVMIQIQVKMTWIGRWIEEKYDLNMQMKRWSREEYQWWKLCQENAFLVKRECWCICNFRMYWLVYFLLYFIVPRWRCLFLWSRESLN